jgi:hypothetical protein
MPLGGVFAHFHTEQDKHGQTNHQEDHEEDH